MPTIKPISELQRNTAALVREAMETKEPIYFTKNGNAAVVIIDAATYDQNQREAEELHRAYVRTSIELGRLQIENGQYYTLDELDAHLRERWGDDAY